MACLIQVALHKALTATEGADGLTGSGFKKLSNLRLIVRDLHTAATAAESSLDGDRQTVLFGESFDLCRIRNRILGARGHRGIGALSDVASGDLIAQVCN